jgi:hypothetical protein
MSDLTADTPRVFESDLNFFYDVPMPASTTFYEGQAVASSHTTGYVKNFAAPTDCFIGFCEKGKTSSATAGADVLRVRCQGIVTLTVTGAASAVNIGDSVYATDGNTFTLTGSSAILIGKVVRWVTSTTCQVFFQASFLRVA